MAEVIGSSPIAPIFIPALGWFMQDPPFQKLVLSEYRDEKGSSERMARITELGDLQVEGYDAGELPQKAWGHEDYEFTLRVDAKFKDSLLLLLIRERFQDSAHFLDWLKLNKIPYDFSAW